MGKMLTFFISSTMIHSKNQTTMVTMIIFLCAAMATWMFFLSNIHWFSVLLLLIYISGVMVLFMFIVSLSPNEKSPIKTKKKTMATLIMSLLAVKTQLESENLKINSSIEWSLLITALTMMVIILMAYLPPKTLKSFYKGMKSTK